MRQYHNLFIYKMIRLVLMLSLCTFFLGCIWFFISSALQEDETETWYYVFKLDEKTIYYQLITSLYFALTMLSTVGYGDFYPISDLEMVFAVICMMIGVGVFSVVMNQVGQIIEKYTMQMGDTDRRKDLDHWILCLQRFNDRQPLAKSLQQIIESDFNFYQTNNRN